MTPAREAELRARPRHDRFYGDTHAALMEALDALTVARAQRDAARLIVDAYAACLRCSCIVARCCDLCVERSQAGAP